MLLPGQFIKLAERNGTIVALEQMVLEQACRQTKTWQQEFGTTLQISVNVSSLHIQQRNLAKHVAGVLESTGLEASLLCLEISESVAMHDVVLTSSVLGELHALGARMAIDDFGTGHSSFGYLARFPFDIVKIDQSFVHGIEDDAVKSAIVSAVVALAQTIDAIDRGRGRGVAGQLQDADGPRVCHRTGLLLRTPDVDGRLRQDAHGQRRRGSPPLRFGPRRLGPAAGLGTDRPAVLFNRELRRRGRRRRCAVRR